MEQTQLQNLPQVSQETSELQPAQSAPVIHAQSVTQQPIEQQQLPQHNDQYEAFKLFLTTAPVNWSPNESIRRFNLPDGSSVSCVLWNELFHITGTDIVKAVTYRFECLGRTITMQKKFEEGIFSDLRNLKPLSDSTLEESRSPFLKFLYENQCIRTQKKQKVFYWFSVKHDKLFLDALERDLKRENAGQAASTASRVPMSMVKSMELAKAQFTPQIQIPNSQNMKQKYQMSAPLMMDHPTPRISSAGHSASSHHYAPILNYSHPLDQISHRSYSPFQQSGHHHVLHPGSPPQGLLTPPIMHQHYNGVSPQIHSLDHHDGYRIHRTDSPLGIHRTDSALGIHRPDSALSVHRTDSPANSIMSYQDGSSHMHYDGAHVLSSMFNPHDHSSSSQYNNTNINNRYSPYQNTMQNPIPIRRHDSIGQSLHYQQMDDASDNKVHECPQAGCNRQFKRQDHLKRHYRSHTGERPYTCIVPDCRLSFARQDHLQQHMRGHNESGFRLDDNMLQSLVNSPQSDFNFTHNSSSVSAYGALEYQPMRSDSRLSMHSSFEPLMSIPTPAPAEISIQQRQSDDAVAATAAAVAVEQVSATEQDGTNIEACDGPSGRVKQEYAQHMEYAMENLLAMDPDMRFQTY